MATDIPIPGSVQAGFERVREAFIANFHHAADDAEVGAALAVYVDGQRVADL